ncbi:Uracil-regulated protein 1 [Hirsutella minnesotensis 3608]|uniref:Uracil-regulated protein 1 n=1 Tax=Hirsutella minnesotensis 3608 TaxID=1043627 RepID=A0A0F7ZSA6_9HYPO|nr:Uracil-regulated protein 1 [Hirsutella minnesotensis 3608]
MEEARSQDEVLDALRKVQQGQSHLLAAVESISDKLALAAGVAHPQATPAGNAFGSEADVRHLGDGAISSGGDLQSGLSSTNAQAAQEASSATSSKPKPGFTSRIVLTTYPKQIGIDPFALDWGNPDPQKRGPVVVSRSTTTIRRRNAIGAHGGSYSIYYALAVASKELDIDHRPDFTNTEPAVQIGPFPQWGHREKIVAMDPWGHLAPWTFKDLMERDNIDLRPTIAITKAHMKLPELEESVKSGRLVPDGKVCLNDLGELAVTKFAVEPVWYLPGVAERFGIDEGTLRRSLFEHTGGSYPELITRGDIKVFLPPIGGLTVYCFGDPAKMSDESVRLSLRIHDECNGSDVFGSDICTCRPYLIFGIEEAVKEAQNGGSGVVIYFRKEGRALGEVTKYLVYNARKRGADRASDYFMRTENIAGVKDMRFQALMPDILHWLGIKKIDRMLSMSNMKHDAIVGQGIPIHERVELPQELIPADSRVEIDAKITAGYFTAGKRLTTEELQSVQGRIWEDIDH